VRKLVSEYCAIEKMDRIVRSAAQTDETELIGSGVRELRRREILLELTNCVIVTGLTETQSCAMTSSPLERNTVDSIETRELQRDNSR
jgi:hypothetical protein